MLACGTARSDTSGDRLASAARRRPLEESFATDPTAVVRVIATFDRRVPGAVVLADLGLAAGDRPRADARLALEAVRTLRVAVVAEAEEVDGDTTRRPGGQQERRAFATARREGRERGQDGGDHPTAAKVTMASASIATPTATAAPTSRDREIGTLPITSPVRPFTAM